jgi:excisionase family DNA binding protein
MFDNLKHQNAADLFTNLVNRNRTPSKADRRRAHEAIQAFERAPYSPTLLTEMVMSTAHGRFSLDDDTLTFTPGDGGNVLNAVADVLTRYVSTIEPTMGKDLLTTKEAAVYLGIAESTFKRHVHGNKSIQPINPGAKQLYFSRSALDAFKRPKAGRPRRTDTNTPEGRD